MKNSKYSEEQREQAKKLYLAAIPPKEIAERVGVNGARTIYNWAKKFEWDKELNSFGTEYILEQRIAQLTIREGKSKLELDELDRLIGNIVTLKKTGMELRERELAMHLKESGATAGRCDDGGNDFESSDREPRQGRKKRKVKNDVSELTEADFERWIQTLFKYQKIQFDNLHQKERWTLKSRQIGLTYEAAGEALYKGWKTGRNQTFLSASRAQAEVFRSYIVNIAAEFFGIELKGNPIRLSTGAEFRFLGTNKNTAQSYSSDLYIDEAFWINKFSQIYEVASAMSTLGKFTITVFSTPSTKQHEAYQIWSGAWWKGKDKERANIEFPSDELLRKTPQLCPDKRWRFVITVHDAIAGGNNLIDLEDILERYSKDAFAYLFLCQFMDEADSIFNLRDINDCMTDGDDWDDVDTTSPRPYGDYEVWLGYDPSRYNDRARLVALAVPIGTRGVGRLKKYKDKFRVLETRELRGWDWQAQAAEIERFTHKYNVTHIGVDVSGIGSGVGELVKSFFPSVVLINYTLGSKTDLILKALDVVNHRRICWKGEEKTIGPSFMAIKRKTTGKNQITFTAERSADIGHADDFFAITHALIKEPLNISRRRESTYAIGR